MENPHVRTWTFPAALAASWALCATVAAAQPAWLFVAVLGLALGARRMTRRR